MRIRSLLLVALHLVFIAGSAQAQDGETAENQLSLDGGSIESQFEYIQSKSNSFQEYKVVKKTWLAKLESNVRDSLSRLDGELAKMQQANAAQDKEILSLKAGVDSARAEMEAAISTKDSISVFGIPTNKAYYNSLVGGLILILGASLLFFIYRYRRSIAVMSEAVRDLEATREEFAGHRKKALEKEQKLMRRLQDELNKQMN